MLNWTPRFKAFIFLITCVNWTVGDTLIKSGVSIAFVWIAAIGFTLWAIYWYIFNVEL